MIEHTYKELYNQDSVDKHLIIAYEGGEITNEDLYSESFELTESLCSQNELRFGSCEASMLKFKIANVVEALKDKWLTVSQVLAEKNDTPFQLGKYKVFSDVPSGDRNYRNIIAYDAMYDIINADVAVWYESLTFPITLKEFRDSFFEYFGIEQDDVELIMDSMTVDKTISTVSISGKDIITAICEINGVFGHINRLGKFAYISLADKIGLYPSVELYPSNSLLPINGPYDATTESLNKSRYISCEYEDFETSFISKLQIRQEENDIGAIVGEGTNTYIVEDNFLVYGKEPEELAEIANKVLKKIRLIQYRPATVSLKGNPCLEVGDAFMCHTRSKEVASYILQRTIRGIQSLRDVFDAEGVYEYAEKVNSVHRDIKKLKGKANVLERTVEQTRSELKDTENNLQSQITQNANGIKTKVTKGSVSSEISQESDFITIKGNRIAITSDYFELSPDGSIKAKNGSFTGTFEQYDSNGQKSIEIKNNQVKVYAWNDDGNRVGSLGSLRTVDNDTGDVTVGIAMYSEYGDYVSLGYEKPDDSSSIQSVIKIDPQEIENGDPPWIRNTMSGTLFSGHPMGIKVKNGLIVDWDLDTATGSIFPNHTKGIQIKNGLIHGWHLDTMTGTIFSGHTMGIKVKDGLIEDWGLDVAGGTLFPDNPGGGIVVKNGLISSWSMNGTTANLFSGHSGGGVTIKNGLICGWDLDSTSGTFSAITGISWSYNDSQVTKITSITRLYVVVKNGLICDWYTEVKNY